MQNVIIDLGGVVLEWDPDQIIRAVFDDPDAQARVKRLIFQHPDWADTDRGTLARVEAVERWAGRTGQTVEEMEALMTASDVMMQPKPGTLALMQELGDQGLDLYCLSNMPTERFAYLRRTFSFWDQFKGIVISAHVRMVKPEPEIFEYILSQYDLNPTRTVFLDDSRKNITAAQNLGIHAILFTTAEECREQLSILLGRQHA
jgi:HAD superfamily hydrolase (TIGR01509 family)